MKIVVSHDVSIGTKHDSDIRYGVSDGISFVGFHTFDKDYFSSPLPPPLPPSCIGIEDSSGARSALIRYTCFSGEISESFYPRQFVSSLSS